MAKVWTEFLTPPGSAWELRKINTLLRNAGYLDGWQSVEMLIQQLHKARDDFNESQVKFWAVEQLEREAKERADNYMHEVVQLNERIEELEDRLKAIDDQRGSVEEAIRKLKAKDQWDIRKDEEVVSEKQEENAPAPKPDKRKCSQCDGKCRIEINGQKVGCPTCHGYGEVDAS